MKVTGKKWHKPQSKEVEVTEDSTSMDCQGKRVGCYAGSSCGSVEKNRPKTRGKPEKK
ncbi:hypothetical protein HZB94_01080 [Candidatus Falkowbacteria bacterium]|nr:hypothetical protein [Candidatus Falkowbacteria bacterium]